MTGHPLGRWDVLILLVGLVLAVASGVVAYRVGGPYGERLNGDLRFHRAIVQNSGDGEAVVFDSSGDLQLDTWSYIEDEGGIKNEHDANADGRIDTWEYYRADETLERLDKDTDGDGEPDYRTVFAPDGDRVVRFEYDDNADGRIDMWEHYRADATIERLEEDTDSDGEPDYRWMFAPDETITAEFDLTSETIDEMDVDVRGR